MNLPLDRADQGGYTSRWSASDMAFSLASFLRPAAFACALLLQCVCAFAAEPVRHVAIYVEPYYRSAENADQRPQVAIGAALSGLLASARREDIVEARDKILADPKLITPMTMMVLAIRLYDVGLRDDAVFWFYVAKDRHITLSEVLDIEQSRLTQADAAVRSFATLAGPVINGYAFCDLARQKELRAKALAWVEQNPYQVIFMDRFAAKPGNRGENLAHAIRTARQNVDKEQAYFADPKHVADFYATRSRNEADTKFCWK
jgi:hypothetical protein